MLAQLRLNRGTTGARIQTSEEQSAPISQLAPSRRPRWWPWLEEVHVALLNTSWSVDGEVQGHMTSAHSSDVELVLRVRSYDETAAKLLYLSHVALVEHVIRSRGMIAEMEDLKQEVFGRIFHKLDLYAGDSSLRTWLFRVADRHVLNVLASRRRARDLEVDASTLEARTGERDVLASAPDPAPSPADLVQSRERRLAVARAVAELPLLLRQVIELQLREELTASETAKRLHVSEGTVRQRLSKARAILSESLRIHAPQKADRKRAAS
jgi:RNA polymerase sigma-70 factor, ECF subfamily